MTKSIQDILLTKPNLVSLPKKALRSRREPALTDYLMFGYIITYEGTTGYTLELSTESGFEL